jgi:hypothetical protein
MRLRGAVDADNLPGAAATLFDDRLFRVQIRQKAASCSSGASRSSSSCSVMLKTAFASACQFFRGRITSISQPTSPSSLISKAISSPLWLRLNHSGWPSAKAGFPCSP